MKTRSEFAQVGIHAGAAGAQTQITIKLNPTIQNQLGLVDAAIQSPPIIRLVPKLSDSPPKVSYLREGVVVNGPELKDTQNSASRCEGQITLQSGGRIFETVNCISGIAPIHSIGLITVVVVVVSITVIDLCRCSEGNCQN